MSRDESTKRSKIGLACAGGVVEGAIYEIGALCAIDESIDGIDFHHLDTYVGVSSGGLIGSILANGVPARELSRAIVSAAHDDSLNLNPEVLFTPAIREYAGRLSKVPRAVFNTLRYYALNPGDLSLLGFLSTFGSLVPTGFFDNTPLANFLNDALSRNRRTDDFRRLPTDLRIVAMHLDSAEVTVFGEPGYNHVPISKAVQASTALPGLYCPVEIDGEHYIDGVARRTVHASVALDAGTDLLFCINPIVPVNVQMEQHANRLLNRTPQSGDGLNLTTSRGPKKRLADHGLPSVLSQTFRAIVDSRKRTGFKKYEHTHPDADLILIEPECDDTSLFFSNIFSFRNRHDVCEHAYQATRAHLRNRLGEIKPVLERHGLTLREDVLNDPNRQLFRDGLPVNENGSNGSPQDVLRETDQVLNRLDAVLDRIQARAA